MHKKKNWVRKLPLVAMPINGMPKSYTKKSPYRIVYDRKLKLPIDVALQLLQSKSMTAIEDYM